MPPISPPPPTATKMASGPSRPRTNSGAHGALAGHYQRVIAGDIGQVVGLGIVPCLQFTEQRIVAPNSAPRRRSAAWPPPSPARHPWV